MPRTVLVSNSESFPASRGLGKTTTVSSVRIPIFGFRVCDLMMRMKQQVGFGIQLFVLTVTPLISWWQLQFGYKLIWMPGLLLSMAVLFWIGTRLREAP